MQIRPANAERIVDVLIGACSVCVERDGEALNPNSCHLVPPFARLTFTAQRLRPTRGTGGQAYQTVAEAGSSVGLGGGLQICQQGFILLVRTDPKPNDHVLLFAKSNSAVAAANANREHRLSVVNLLEMEARMVRAVGEELI